MSTEPLMTDAEHRALDLTAELVGLLAEIMGTDADAFAQDMAELVHHVHAIQRAVLAQAAAREYPGRYRLLGARLR